jgi:hypothetical protein
MDKTDDNDPWDSVTVTSKCDKCGRRLATGNPTGLLRRCELVNALLVERYDPRSCPTRTAD